MMVFEQMGSVKGIQFSLSLVLPMQIHSGQDKVKLLPEYIVQKMMFLPT